MWMWAGLPPLWSPLIGRPLLAGTPEAPPPLLWVSSFSSFPLCSSVKHPNHHLDINEVEFFKQQYSLSTADNCHLTFLSFSLSFFFSFFSLPLFFLVSCGTFSLSLCSAGLFSTSGRWVLTGSFSLSASGLERLREIEIRWTERGGDSEWGREPVTWMLRKASVYSIYGSKV